MSALEPTVALERDVSHAVWLEVDGRLPFAVRSRSHLSEELGDVLDAGTRRRREAGTKEVLEVFEAQVTFLLSLVRLTRRKPYTRVPGGSKPAAMDSVAEQIKQLEDRHLTATRNTNEVLEAMLEVQRGFSARMSVMQEHLDELETRVETLELQPMPRG